MDTQQRNIVLDMMKGIGILLMMLCHLVYADGPIKQFIYSFHMPLFFIIAGYLAKDLTDNSQYAQFTIKNAKRLLLPYAVTMLMLCAWGGVQAFAKQDISYFLRHLFSMLSASADGWDSPWGLIYAGPMWFLIALFVAKDIFGALQLALNRLQVKYKDELLLSVCIILSVIAVITRPFIPSLPFCIMQAFAALAFYAVGWYVYKHPVPWWVYGLCVITWPVAIIYGGVELESAYLDYYPLSVIGACGGTYVVYLLCKGMDKLHSYSMFHISNIPSPLAWCGMYSLPILCCHELEMYSDIIYSLKYRYPSVDILPGKGEIGIAIILAAIVIHIPYLKKVYQ